jgi:hypothetical protein
MRNSNYANAYNSGTSLGRFMRSLFFCDFAALNERRDARASARLSPRAVSFQSDVRKPQVSLRSLVSVNSFGPRSERYPRGRLYWDTPDDGFFSWDRQCRNCSTSTSSNCILIFECLDEPFSYDSCNLCIGVIALPRAGCRWRRSDCSVRLPVYPRRPRDMSQTPETKHSNAELFERMQDMNRSWIERLRDTANRIGFWKPTAQRQKPNGSDDGLR